MPTTRRSADRRSAAGPGKQSTLSFSTRVTKSIPHEPTGKEQLVTGDSAAPRKKDVVVDDISEPESEPEAASKVEVEEEKVKDASLVAEGDVEHATEETEETDEAVPVVPQKSEAELRAERVTDAQINKYWRRVEAERTAKRVHQEDLSVGEKVLRYFDASSHYGPCVGVTRTKRWHRAQRLGLSPPIEVLAVLLKEDAKGTRGIEVAEMDVILNHTTVGAI